MFIIKKTVDKRLKDIRFKCKTSTYVLKNTHINNMLYK